MHRGLRLLMGTALLALLGACVGYPPPRASYPGSYGAPVYGAPGHGYPRAADPQRVVRCESQDGRSRRCPADVRGGVGISRQLSRAPCIQGRTWGYDAGGIWVDRGCRAEFAVGGYGYGRYGDARNVGDLRYGQRTIRCESIDGRERHCAASLRGAALRKQVSRAPCVQGRNWRWDSSGIWVKDGCRADFAVW